MILCAVPRNLVTAKGSTWQVEIKVIILNKKLLERTLITAHTDFPLKISVLIFKIAVLTRMLD